MSSTDLDNLETVAPTRERARARKLAARIAGAILLAAVLYFLAGHLNRDLRAHPWSQLRIEVIFLIPAVLSLLTARLMNVLSCRELLKGLGNDLPLRGVLAGIWLSSLGRYIPGKVAVVAGSTMALVRLGARLPSAGAALFLSTATMMLTGLIAALPLSMTPQLRRILPSAPMLALIIAAVGLICLYPPILLKLINVILRWMKRPPMPGKVSRGPFWMAVLFTAMRCASLGLGLWFAARSLVPLSIAAYPQVLAAAALASTIGFLAVFAPAGIGVHEEVHRTALFALVGPPIGWLIAMFRILHILVDLIAAAIALAVLRFSR